MRGRKFPILLLCALLTLPAALAQSGHIVLLSVEESSAPFAPQVGSTADLYLEIRAGTGQIFIDSFPLTRLDTQSSTRYANQVACSYTGKDCSQYDFFYTFRLDSAVIGGPSAGGAIATLTAAMLEGKSIDESIAMTGTINSGGIIGPVAGEKAKALAAKDRGLSKVLISAFSYPTETNQSYLRALNLTGSDLNATGINLSLLYVPVNLSTVGILIVEVSTLDEALRIFTHEPPQEATDSNVSVDPSYDNIMRGISQSLCSRRDSLSESLFAQGIINESREDQNLTIHRTRANASGDWYSLASYCFGDLAQLRGQAFEKLSQSALRSQYRALMGEVKDFEANLGQRNLTTLAELETAMIVDERLREAKDQLRDINSSDINGTTLGFVYERVNSANVWSAFFQMQSPRITLDNAHLGDACDAKVAEADERISYAGLYLPSSYLVSAQDALETARADAEAGRFAYCLFSASKAQALADLFAGTLSIPKDKVDSLVARKLSVVAGVISAQEVKGYFPIIGYSYYQYASSLAAHDAYSALTFAEYSLELSTLDMYFPNQRGFHLPQEMLTLIGFYASALLLGIVIGVLLTMRFIGKGKKLGARKRR
jgi:uncharacterized protein